MIPGHLLTSELWKQQEQHLTPHYPCILPEIPEAETVREMASMILDQIPESFFLAGLSMGGMIALEILNIASERVLKLALLDTTAARRRWKEAGKEPSSSKMLNAKVLRTPLSRDGSI